MPSATHDVAQRSTSPLGASLALLIVLVRGPLHSRAAVAAGLPWQQGCRRVCAGQEDRV